MPKRLWARPSLQRDDIGYYSRQSLTYREWVEAAGRVRDQGAVWRQHELYARTNYRKDHDAWIDLGGEA